MDFLYGIMLIILIIFGLYNFGSVSMSDSKNSKNPNQSTNISTQNYLFASKNSNFENSSEKKPPQPMIANSPLALNKKINLDLQTFDYEYNKYFFV